MGQFILSFKHFQKHPLGYLLDIFQTAVAFHLLIIFSFLKIKQINKKTLCVQDKFSIFRFFWLPIYNLSET